MFLCYKNHPTKSEVFFKWLFVSIWNKIRYLRNLKDTSSRASDFHRRFLQNRQLLNSIVTATTILEKWKNINHSFTVHSDFLCRENFIKSAVTRINLTIIRYIKNNKKFATHSKLLLSIKCLRFGLFVASLWTFIKCVRWLVGCSVGKLVVRSVAIF